MGHRIGKWVRMLSAPMVVALGLQSAPVHSQTVYFHNDTSGSPIAATDESGNLLWRESYRPYGERMLKPSAANTQWFHGKQLDPDTGMEDFGSRNYDPILGRFLSVDPVDFSDKNIHSFNRYAYGNNNPLKYKDPDGDSALDIGFFLFDGAKLAVALYTGVGVGAAAKDFTFSAIGVASPIPGVGQFLKATRTAEHAIEGYRVAGKAREAITEVKLVAEYGREAVQREQYLRNAAGKIVKGPDGTARRIDHVVIQDGKAVRSVETTSLTASKTQQAAKEQSIRDAGGTYIRDRNTGNLVDFKEVTTEIVRGQ